jgi:uncharacterized protein (TIGR02231 family)
MKKAVNILIFIFIFLISATYAFARITKVELYPKGARIFATTSIPDKSTLYLDLPGSAKPETLTFYGQNNLQIESFSYEQTKKASPLISDLKNQIKNLKLKKQKINAALKAQNISLTFWQEQTRRRDISLKKLNTFNELIVKNIEKIQVRINDLNNQLTDIKNQIEHLKQKITDLTNNAPDIWKVEVITRGHGSLRYSYFDTGAGWQSYYTISAFPSQKKALLKWEARIWQKTGLNWQNIDLVLISGHFSSRLKPPKITPWIITPRQDIFKAMETEMLSRKMPISAGTRAFLEKTPKIMQKQGSYFDQYLAGKVNLASGEKKIIALQNKQLKASYVYLIRPFFSPRAYLKASIKFNQTLKLPPGKARLFLENTFIGKTALQAWGKGLVLYFGEDPQIKTSFLAHKEQGEQGIFQKDKIYTYVYELKVKNLKNQPVKVRIEDAKIETRENQIKVTPTFSLKPEENKEIFLWKLTLKPGEEKTLRYKYEISYPEELDIDMGR